MHQNYGIVTLIALTIIISINNFYDNNISSDYVNEKLYPVGATKYIKENLDYKNMRIYNGYDYGSYLMLNDIPVFIDSRLDVYCSEFNDTEIFYDFVQVFDYKKNYEDVFTKYDFTHVLIPKKNSIYIYITKDPNYKVLYEDDNFVLYDRIIHN